MDSYSPELQQRIRDLANYPMDKNEVYEVWTEILKFHFPISQTDRPGNNEYVIQATPSTVFPFVQLSVTTRLAIPIHDGLEIHGAITFGPHIRFYRLMANGIFGCCLWDGRDSLHVLHDHCFIAQHLEEIKSDWLSVYVPEY